MAITTMDGLIAAMPGQHRHSMKTYISTTKAAGLPQSLWGGALTGNPAPGPYPSASLTWVVPTSSTPGAIPFTNPTTGLSYIGRIAVSSNTSVTLTLYDRLAHTGAITYSGPAAQTLTTTPLTRPDALGSNVELWWEWITASSVSVSNMNCSYTNQAGTAGQTTVSLIGQTSSVVGQMQPFRLAGGDTGVRSVESFTVSGANSGTGMLVLLRRILDIPVPTTNVATILDAFATGMPQVYDSACLAFLFVPIGSSTPIIQSSVQIVQG